MNMLLSILVDGVSYGMILFIISIGLSITMGLMRVVNMAHGGFAMLGGFMAAAIMAWAGTRFEAALAAASVAVALISVPIERLLVRQVYGRHVLDQALLSIGLIYIIVAGANLLFGASITTLQIPHYLTGWVAIGNHTIPKYRLFVTVAGLIIVALLWVAIERTSFGVRIRAAVDNSAIAQTVGINTSQLYAIAFAVGAALAALGGIIGAQIMPMESTYALKYLVLMLAVVTVGGMGTVTGTFAAALLLGLANTAAIYLVPSMASVAFYIAMFLVLTLRPQGLFGRSL
ncbi:MAG: branched-chain amino acid ABC transporter permease [Hyphomicrobiaceae bacterium]|nr:branched-chain amino acid ABC transporter permease [Hyphomicrobiaceae bacterium]